MVIFLGCVLAAPIFQALSAIAQPPPIKDDRFVEGDNGLGYVAVLSTQKTAEDALKVFADLQQRYPEELRHTIPAVLEADLKANASAGSHWLLIVGPPGSRERLLALCEQLASAGFVGCWVRKLREEDQLR